MITKCSIFNVCVCFSLSFVSLSLSLSLSILLSPTHSFMFRVGRKGTSPNRMITNGSILNGMNLMNRNSLHAHVTSTPEVNGNSLEMSSSSILNGNKAGGPVGVGGEPINPDDLRFEVIFVIMIRDMSFITTFDTTWPAQGL